MPPPPFLALGRPFAPAQEVPFSRTYPYGSDGGGWLLLHHGLDYGLAAGQPVVAVADGIVTHAGDDAGLQFGPQTDFYGGLVVLRHAEELGGEPLFSLYGHLSETRVRRGRSVARGDVVGLVGGTGIALGPHLHLELRTHRQDYARTLNPVLFLQPREGEGVIAGRYLNAYGRAEPGETIALFDLGAGGAWVAETTTYLWGPINRAPGVAETFTFADLPAGRYRLERQGEGPAASAEVEVGAGELTVVTLRAGRTAP